MSDNKLVELIRSEYKKCAQSCEYFLDKYAYIQHPIKGKIPFKLYSYQKDVIVDFDIYQNNIILKGRQIGISTVVAGRCLWVMTFHSNKNILVVATKKDVAKNLVTKVKYMNDNLPSWLKATCITNNKLSLEFSNGSTIKAEAATDTAGRSEALTLLIIDEAAFIDNAQIIWEAASSTLATGGNAIILSTPNGMGNFFHRMWQGAEAKQNDFHTKLLDWQVHPDRDQEWRDRQTELLGEMASAQEHDASFIFSGNTVIHPEIIEFYRKTYVQEPIAYRWFDQNMWVWEYADNNSTYVLAADIARGDGQDFSTFHIIDVERSVQVAEYKGKITTRDFANLMVVAATEYNDALIIPDNSNIGWDAIQRIIDRGYPNLFYMSKDLKYVDTEQQLDQDMTADERKMIPGFTISQRTRPLIIAKFESYMRENSVIIRSSRFISELETFIWKNGRAEALDLYNDDLVIAMCIGLWVRDTALRLRAEGIELNKSMIDRITRVMPDPVMMPKTGADPYLFPIFGTEIENLRWLLNK
jgi:hypothetical protein